MAQLSTCNQIEEKGGLYLHTKTKLSSLIARSSRSKEGSLHKGTLPHTFSWTSFIDQH